MSESREIVLEFGSQRAVVSTLGASLRRYFVVGPEEGAEIDLLWGYQGDENKKAGQGDVLIPWPSRVKDGKYTFAGREHQLPKNDKEGPNAIHGFMRDRIWGLEPLKKGCVRFNSSIKSGEYADKGYPFDLEASITYRLDRFGLTCEFTLLNCGTQSAPAGVGFHPYFTVGTSKIDEAKAKIPAARYLEFDNLIPTGKILTTEGSALDFRQLKRIGETRFNHCFTDLIRDANGLAWAQLSHPELEFTLKVWMDEAFPYLVVYSGEAIPEPDRRASLAIEPMTCATDAFNHPDWGLLQLEPGQRASGRWGVTTSLA